VAIVRSHLGMHLPFKVKSRVGEETAAQGNGRKAVGERQRLREGGVKGEGR